MIYFFSILLCLGKGFSIIYKNMLPIFGRNVSLLCVVNDFICIFPCVCLQRFRLYILMCKIAAISWCCCVWFWLREYIYSAGICWYILFMAMVMWWNTLGGWMAFLLMYIGLLFAFFYGLHVYFFRLNVMSEGFTILR